jgi:hypothetical protein
MKTFEAVFNGVICSHTHTTKRQAEECAAKWMEYLLTEPYGLMGKPGSIWDNLHDGDHTTPFVREKLPFPKAPIWCMRCKKYVPRVHWSGHYKRNHGPEKPHPSHRMGAWTTEIRCPGSEPRFYGVRKCKRCGYEELSHPAGHFIEELRQPCGTT